ASDQSEIQGTWKVLAFPGADPEKLKDLTVVITDKELQLWSGGLSENYPYQLDPSQKPKAITLTVKDKRKALNGIYLLEGKDLKLLWDANGGPRPTEFPKDSEKVVNMYRFLVLKFDGAARTPKGGR